MKNVLSKISTITRKAWEANPSKYDQERNSTLHTIANSNCNFNFNVKVNDKPF